jgi:pyrimidine deaminase RibD-like protein
MYIRIDNVTTNMLRKCYDNVDVDISKPLADSQRKYLQKCVRLAEKSLLNQKHGCVIVDKKTGVIISQGYNSNLKNHTNVSSLHAEIAAICKAKKNVINAIECDMYIVRIGKNGPGNLRYSKPCPHCSFVIQTQTRIRHVYYSINDMSL